MGLDDKSNFLAREDLNEIGSELFLSVDEPLEVGEPDGVLVSLLLQRDLSRCRRSSTHLQSAQL